MNSSLADRLVSVREARPKDDGRRHFGGLWVRRKAATSASRPPCRSPVAAGGGDCFLTRKPQE